VCINEEPYEIFFTEQSGPFFVCATGQILSHFGAMRSVLGRGSLGFYTEFADSYDVVDGFDDNFDDDVAIPQVDEAAMTVQDFRKMLMFEILRELNRMTTVDKIVSISAPVSDSMWLLISGSRAREVYFHSIQEFCETVLGLNNLNGELSLQRNGHTNFVYLRRLDQNDLQEFICERCKRPRTYMSRPRCNGCKSNCAVRRMRVEKSSIRLTKSIRSVEGFDGDVIKQGYLRLEFTKCSI
jgi:hypothetical protein